MPEPTSTLHPVVRSGRLRRVIAHSAVLGLILTLVIGVSPAAAAGTLTGTVTGDGAALVGVTVELTAAGDSTVISSTTTDASGGYTLTPDAGTYDLTARPPSGSPYGASTVSGVEVVDGAARDVDVVLVTVGDPPAVYGTVRVGGDPVTGADIRLQEFGTTNRSFATSDSDGAWVAVPPSRTGNLDVGADGACNTSSSTVPEQWSLSSTYDVDDVTTYDVGPRFVRLQVTVLTADGSPVEGARVESLARVVQDAAPRSAQVSAVNRGNTGCPANLTDVDGRASLVTVPGGTTNLEIYPSDGSTLVLREVEVGATSSEVSVALPPPPVSVSGTILGWDGQPARDVQVWLEDGSRDIPVAQTSGEASGDGSFSFEAIPGDYTLRLQGGDNEDVGPNFLVTRPLTVPAGTDLDLGTWQAPLSAVDLRVSLADTGEEVRVALIQSGLRPRIDTAVFGAPGTVSGGGAGFTSNTETTDTGPAVMVAGATYTLVPNSRSTATVPDGYDWPDGGWQVTGGATGTSSTATLELEPTQTASITGRVLQDGSPVQGVVVAVVRGELVRTNTDGTFSLPSRVGEVDLSINSGSGEADAPNFASGRLYNLVVPETGLDLGDLELPWVPLDVRVATPPGEDPVFVEMETNFTTASIDGGWGPISWSGGYIDTGGYTQPLLADGTPTILWFTPSTQTVRFTFAPVDPDSPYQDVLLSRVVQQGGDILQVQLQREGTPVDLPPSIGGVTPRSLGESAPNVRLSVAAEDPEGEAVTITWDVLGITPAPTGPTVDLGPFDGPFGFDAVATACDPADNCASFTIEVEIRDIPPTLEADLPTSVGVGEPATLTASAADVRDDVTVNLDWGDGSSGSVTGGAATHSWAAAGTYDVAVQAVTDDATTTETLTVEVEAPEPDPPVAPVVTVPTSPVTATAPRGTTSVAVDFTVSADTGTPACDPVPGSAFPIGTTTVTCTASDVAGTTGTASFDVVVTEAAAPDDDSTQEPEPPVDTEPPVVIDGATDDQTIEDVEEGGPMDSVEPTATDDSGTVEVVSAELAAAGPPARRLATLALLVLVIGAALVRRVRATS